MKFLLFLLILTACTKQPTPLDPITPAFYEKDIIPIIKKHCVQCHNPAWKDKDWTDYETARINAGRIRERVFILKTMPPGNFTGMTDEERKKIRDWVDSGAKR